MNHCTNKWNIIIDFEEAESYKESSNAQTIEEVITEASKNNYIKEHLYEITNMWISHHEEPYETYYYDEPMQFNDNLNSIVWRKELNIKMRSNNKNKELITLTVNE